MSRRRLAGLAVAVVLVMLFGGRWFAARYTENLWFEQLGHGGRYRSLLAQSIAWQLIVLATSGLWFATHLFAVYRSIGSVQLPRRLGNLEISEAVPRRILRNIALSFAGVLALATTWAFADLHRYVALYRNAMPIGLPDPVLERDASFYLARLPLLEVSHLLAMIALLLAAFVVVSLYALTGSLTVERRRVRITPHARTHLVVLMASLALVIAWGFQLDALQLVAGSGTRNGVLSAVDRTVRIPASHALALIALVVAAGSVLSLRWSRPLILFVLWTTLAAASLLGRFLVPAMSDAWDQERRPTVSASLAQHGQNHTRFAFGLLDLPERPIGGEHWQPDSATRMAQSLSGLSPWSGELPLLHSALARTLMGDTAHGRALSWTVAPVPTQSGRPALLAVAQADLVALAALPARPPWDELHREGLAWGADPVALDGRLRAGPPVFLESLADGDSALPGTPVQRTSGRVRFLPRMADLGIVGPNEGTVDQSPPGVPLRGMLRRVMLAWALQAPPLMDSHTSPADRVVYWRDVPARLTRLYSFATFDAPRPALVDGRLLWVADGYVVSRRFPLSERLRWNGETINYLGALYLATVDAETGATLLYLRGQQTGFAQGIARAEGVTPLPASSVPRDLVRQLAYPASLLGAQTTVLGRLMATAGAPAWLPAAPDSATRDPATIEPAVVLMSQDASGPRLWSYTGLVEPRASRLAGLLGGAVGPAGTLELMLFRVYGSIPGPQTAAARLATAPVVVAATVAAGGPGALRQGPVWMIPAAGTVLYARMLHGQMRGASGAAPMTPIGVAVLGGGRIGFGADAAAAIRALGRDDGGADLLLGGGANLADARAAFLALDSARAAGDWERFGRAWTALRRALELESAVPGPRP